MGTHTGADTSGAIVSDSLTTAARELLGDPGEWTPSDRFHDGLALAIIDAIQAGAGEYAKSVRAVDRYRAYRRARGGADRADGARDLLRTFEEVGGAMAWSGKIGNYKLPYSDANSLRATTIQSAAESLHALGVDSAEDLRAAIAQPAGRARVRDAWLSATAAADETAWAHLLMLVGAPWIHPQSLSERFAVEALGSDPGAARIRELLAEAARDISVPLPELEHAIWRWELNRSRPAGIPTEPPRIRAAA